MNSIELKGYVRWADADAAGRLYFPRIFDYCGEAERELMRRTGFSQEDGFDFPRVHAECEFRKVLALYASFTMRISVGKLGRTSIRYDFRVFADGEEDEPAAAGSITVVVMQHGRPVEIPTALRAALAAEG
jgi:YbgC/YbaW family acyl-CoA thioester hydrolase